MRFPPSFIERLRSHFLMSEVVGNRVPVKKHGREYHACCPFHNEKTPSFTVNDEKGFFHCFGCGAHGDAIEFIRRYERLTYPESIEKLARDAGIPLPLLTPQESKKFEQEKTLYDVMEAATKWFEQQLSGSSGNIARDYIEKRGLKPETVRQFRIGYSPEDRNPLNQFLTKAGFAPKLQAEAGLIIQPESGGGAYDRFRGRVMFPIRNASGKVIAFGGRLLAAQSSGGRQMPKYLNSPETPLFKKGEMLFNLDQAKQPARTANMVVVLEGYMDVVSVAQAGVAYAVATLGTAVTPEHLRLLWQVAKEPILCLDGDAAGDRAMKRAAEVALPLLKPGCSIRFATLPQGEDPDTYVQKHGRISFEKILTSSRRLSQIIWGTLKPNYNFTLPESRAALDDACKQLANKITDVTVKTHYLSYFKKQLWEQAPPLTKQGKSIKQQQTSRSPLIEQMVVSHHSAALDTLAQRLLKTILQFPMLLHKSHVEETLSRMDIRNHKLDALRNTLLTAIGHTDIDHADRLQAYVHSALPDHMISELIASAHGMPNARMENEKDAEKLWTDTLGAYEVAHLQLELKEVEESMGISMNDAAYQRMVELQAALRKAHEGRTFAPVETDIA